MNDVDVDKIVRRTYRYWYEDGLSEIAGGLLVFALVGLYFLIQATTDAGWFAIASAIGLPIIVISGSLFSRRAIRALKARITYPRTGYVAYRQPNKNRRWLTGAFAGVMAMVVALLFIKGSPISPRWIPMFDGLAIGAALLYSAYRFDLARFYVLAALSVAVGIAASFLTRNETAGSAAYFGITGLAMMLGGILTLISYLRRTRPPQEEA